MDQLIPKTFTDALGGVLIAVALGFAVVSLWSKERPHATRLLGIFALLSLALFTNNPVTYFASVFIVATVVTELDFLQNLAAIVWRDKNWFGYRASVHGQVATAQLGPPQRTATEYKILNTCWTKQVNKWPDLSQFFALSIGGNEHVPFREAAYKLVGQGLLREVDGGMFCLTPTGVEYCRQHAGEFPVEQWWPEEQLILANASIVPAHPELLVK